MMYVRKNNEKEVYNYIRDNFSYDDSSGRFTWLISPTMSVKAGDISGYVTRDGYVETRIKYGKYPDHRLVFLWLYGRWPKHFIDHLDGDRTNNRPSNIRECDDSENQHNRPMQRNNTTGYVGVVKAKCGYEARINLKGKRYYLGTFADPESAYARYLEAKAEMHPFYPTVRQAAAAPDGEVGLMTSKPRNAQASTTVGSWSVKVPADRMAEAILSMQGPDGEALDGTLWLGQLDDGTYGVHLSCDECPEEGSITLAVLPDPTGEKHGKLA